MRIPLFRSSLFKIPVPRKFEYNERYSDVEREKRNKRLKEIKDREGSFLKGDNRGRAINFNKESGNKKSLSYRPMRVITLIAMLSIALALYLFQIKTLYATILLLILVFLLYRFSKSFFDG